MNFSLSVRQPTRLDHALLAEMQKTLPISRRYLKDLFEAKRVHFRGRPARPSLLISGEHQLVSVLEFHPDELQQPHATAAPHPFLPMIFENDELLILNKTSGTPSTPKDENDTQNAVSSALASHPKLRALSNHPQEPGLLHRLDNGTSGLLAFAKTQSAFEKWSERWRNSGIQKTYRAVLTQKIQAPFPHLIQEPIGHDAHKEKKMTCQPPFRGAPRPAETKILNCIRIGNTFDATLQIQKGARHQIRIHLAQLGSPLLGDPLYGGKPSTRLWLHAWKIDLPDIGNVEAPLPKEWPRVDRK